MPEYYKKVVCRQFTLTPQEKESLSKQEPVFFEGQAVKSSSPGHYHILYPVGDRLIPVYESDWIVRQPEIEIKKDHDFRTQYLAVENPAPEPTEKKLATKKPNQSSM